MKKIPTLTTCLLAVSFFIPITAVAAPQIGTMPEGMCTRDINEWGHASQCSCADQETYDQRSGLCLTGVRGEKITISGHVAAPMAAIGGESTGFVLETSEETSHELVLKMADREKLQELNGRLIDVTGENIFIRSIERGERPAIIVETISVLD